jgi:[acyl-carrier-protein] S-malonyltransferase
MGKVAFIFPGQASQYPGMGKELAEKYPSARGVFEEADKALGFSMSKLCFEGTEDELKLTVKLVRKRGTYMQDAVLAGQGSMAAIMGLSPTVVVEVCKKAAQGEVCSPANLNSPEQTVISGSAAAVKRAVEIASQSGAKRAVVLAVSAPFHCALMMPAQEKLEKDLHAIKFAELQMPLVTNVDADDITKGEEARSALVRQVTMPVRWEESMRTLLDDGVNTFVEVGPGKVLTGLMRQIERSVTTLNVEDEKSLVGTLDKIAGAKSDAA